MNKKLLAGCLIGFAVLAALCVLVEIPVLFLQTNPSVVREPNWDSPQTRALAQRACFDCHSNETNWAWYTRVPPFSILTTLDVIRGRGHLNFSEWGVAQRGGEGGEGEGRGGGREVGEQITRGEMPPSNYLALHPEARLTNEEKLQLIQGLEKSLR